MSDPQMSAEQCRAERNILWSKIVEHQKRCRALPVASAVEVQQLVAKFFAEHGGVTLCPPVHLVPSRWAGTLAVMPI